MKKFGYLLAALSIILTSCETPQPGPVPKFFCRSFINYYLAEFDGFLLGQTYYPHTSKQGTTEVFRPGYIRFWGTVDNQKDIVYGQKYDSLCMVHSDMGYNRYRSELIYMPSTQLESISVVCDKDFDAEHPAGTPLDDIVYLVSASPSKYIRSGYTDTYDWIKGEGLSPHYASVGFLDDDLYHMGNDRYHSEFHPVQGYLNQLSASDLEFATGGYGIFPSLAFDREPETDGPHNITVTLRCVGGKVLTSTIAAVLK